MVSSSPMLQRRIGRRLEVGGVGIQRRVASYIVLGEPDILYYMLPVLDMTLAGFNAHLIPLRGVYALLRASPMGKFVWCRMKALKRSSGAWAT